MSKVTLPKEVGEAIENVRLGGRNNRAIVAMANGVAEGHYEAHVIRTYAGESPDNFDNLLTALVNGYEVEKTPEDNLREYYGRIQDDIDRYDYGMSLIEAEAKRCVVNDVLRILGITIEGINE